MKRQEEYLTQKLVRAWNQISDLLDEPRPDPELELRQMRQTVSHALAATANGPEMQQLVVWLSAESNKEAVKRSPDYKQALLYVLDYIYGEFGYE